MNMKTTIRFGFGALTLATSLTALAGAVVVSKNSPIGAMGADEVKRVFLGRESQIGGNTVTLIYQKDETNRDAFESKVLGKTGADLSAYWAKLIFTGRATAPVELPGGDASVHAGLATSPNAIGYVTDAGIDSSVKVIFRY